MPTPELKPCATCPYLIPKGQPQRCPLCPEDRREPPSPPASSEIRERVARIIDPLAYWDGVGWKHGYDSHEEAREAAQQFQSAALAKADAILALFPTPNAEVLALVERAARILFERGRVEGNVDPETWEAAGDEMQQWLLGHARAISEVFIDAITTLSAERDEARAIMRANTSRASASDQAWAAKLQAAEARVRELEGVLEPFARKFRDHSDWPDTLILEVSRFNAVSFQRRSFVGLRVADFRRARAVLGDPK